jgi:hypothetical protein
MHCIKAIDAPRREWMSRHGLSQHDITMIHALDAPNVAIEVAPEASDSLAIYRRSRREHVRRWILLYTDRPAALAQAAS